MVDQIQICAPRVTKPSLPRYDHITRLAGRAIVKYDDFNRTKGISP